MEDNQSTITSGIHIIDLKQVFDKFVKNWKPILTITVIGGILGAICSLGIPRKYTVVSVVAPELSLRTNNLASLASITGMSSLLSNNNDALLPSVYPYIVSSTPFLVELSEMPVNEGTLYDYILNDTKMSWYGFVLSLPARAISGIKSLFIDETESDKKGIDPFQPTKEQSAILKSLSKAITVNVDKKTYLVTLTVTMQDPVIAANLSQLVISNLKKNVIKYRTQKTEENVEYLESVSKEAYDEYLLAQTKYAYFLDHNQSISIKSGLVEQLMLQNDVTLKFQLYSSLESELQQNRSRLTQETPVFAEICPPSVPVRSSNSRKSVALAFAFLGFLCGCAYVFFKKE